MRRSQKSTTSSLEQTCHLSAPRALRGCQLQFLGSNASLTKTMQETWRLHKPGCRSNGGCMPLSPDSAGGKEKTQIQGIFKDVRFYSKLNFGQSLPTPSTFHNVKNHGGGCAKGVPRIAGNEEQKKTKKTTHRGKPRQTEIKQQRKTLGTGQTIRVFFGENVAGRRPPMSPKTRLVPVSVFWCLGD